MGKNGLSIAIVGKDVSQANAYLLVEKALRLAAISSQIDINIIYIDSHSVDENNVDELLNDMDAILVPGGFNSDGTEGMIVAISYARTNNVPFLGICLGMQLTVIEYARNVVGLLNATSSEFDNTAEHKVIDRIAYLKNGSLREGTFTCHLKEGSFLEKCYQSLTIKETFRQGYTFNTYYRELLENNGLLISAYSEDNKLIEAVELANHQFYVGVQFHPEQTNIGKPHPLFLGFIEAAFKKRKE